MGSHSTSTVLTPPSFYSPFFIVPFLLGQSLFQSYSFSSLLYPDLFSNLFLSSNVLLGLDCSVRKAQNMASHEFVYYPPIRPGGVLKTRGRPSKRRGQNNTRKKINDSHAVSGSSGSLNFEKGGGGGRWGTQNAKGYFFSL